MRHRKHIPQQPAQRTEPAPTTRIPVSKHVKPGQRLSVNGPNGKQRKVFQRSW